jgi:molybdenum cofactor cytidylyltransferase
MLRFNVVLAAAGGSSRLGQPKQLLNLDGRPLVVRALQTALISGAEQVVVVLGAHADEVKAACAGLGMFPNESFTRFIVNERWQEGMGGSIRVGISAVGPKAEVAVLMLCDQPKVTSPLLRSLVEAISEQTPIAACRYEGMAGAPCAFHRSVFPELMKLEGDRGARDIIRDPSRAVRLVEFEGGAVDVDEPEDVERLRSSV